MTPRQRTPFGALCQFQQAKAWEIRRDPYLRMCKCVPSSVPPEEGFSFSETNGGGKQVEQLTDWAWAQSNFYQKKETKIHMQTRRQADD